MSSSSSSLSWTDKEVTNTKHNEKPVHKTVQYKSPFNAFACVTNRNVGRSRDENDDDDQSIFSNVSVNSVLEGIDSVVDTFVDNLLPRAARKSNKLKKKKQHKHKKVQTLEERTVEPLSIRPPPKIPNESIQTILRTYSPSHLLWSNPLQEDQPICSVPEELVKVKEDHVHNHNENLHKVVSEEEEDVFMTNGDQQMKNSLVETFHEFATKTKDATSHTRTRISGMMRRRREHINYINSKKKKTRGGMNGEEDLLVLLP